MIRGRSRGAFAIGLVCVLFALGLACQSSAEPIRVMTYNILIDDPSDDVRSWQRRAPGVMAIIEENAPDIFGLQEANIQMVKDVAGRFSAHQWVGVGRDDGHSAGEHCPIFFRKERFDLLQTSTFWLSDTPDEPGSMGWGALLPRIATWALLRDKVTQSRILVVNVHLDHRSALARIEGVKLIAGRLGWLMEDSPPVLMGDFNSTRVAAPYQHLIQLDSMADAELMSLTGHRGPSWSFRALGGLYKSRVDFFFVHPDWQVLHHGIVDRKWEGDFPSDHLPVLVEITAPDVAARSLTAFE